MQRDLRNSVEIVRRGFLLLFSLIQYFVFYVPNLYCIEIKRLVNNSSFCYSNASDENFSTRYQMHALRLVGGKIPTTPPG